MLMFSIPISDSLWQRQVLYVYIYINEYNIPSLFQYLAQLIYIYMFMFIPMIHETNRDKTDLFFFGYCG